MMDVLYPQFVDGDIPKDQNIWEVQRLGVAPDLPPLFREIALSNVLIAMERFSFKRRIHQLMLLTFVGIAKKRLTDMAPMGPVGQHLGFPHIAVIGTPDPALHASRRRELAKFEASIIQEKAA
jgi:N-acyl-L-homoserine lactone synthetase